MSENQPDTPVDEKPPVGRSWNQLYLFVIGFAFLLIIFFSVFSGLFR